ncbi:hypothetical protein Gotur_007106 [Gossypium turneri]
MAKSLIRLDGKHISIYQLQMTYIRTLPVPPSHIIEPYWRDARFLHVTFMSRGVNWTPHLKAHWWKGGDSRCTHSIFHAASVLSLLRACSYISSYQWMGR